MSSTDTHSLTALRRGVIKGLELIDCELRSSAGWTVPMPSTPWFTSIRSLGFSTWIAYINVSCLNEMKVKTCTRAIFFNPWPVTHQLSHVIPFWHTIYHSINRHMLSDPGHRWLPVTPLRSQVTTCDMGHWTIYDFILWYIVCQNGVTCDNWCVTGHGLKKMALVHIF